MSTYKSSKEESKRDPVGVAMRCLGGVLLFYSFWLAYQGRDVTIAGTWKDWDSIKKEQLVLWVIWTVIPPLWFSFEYWRKIHHGAYLKNNAPEEFESLRYEQDLASKIWLAVASTLFVLYFGKDLVRDVRGSGESPAVCVCQDKQPPNPAQPVGSQAPEKK